jgi:large subunit ribosomal protein L10
MPTPKKQQAIEELTEVFTDSAGVFLADFSGLSVEHMTELRKRCHAEEVGFKVVKNTLAHRAAEAAGYPDLSEWLVGSTAVAYSRDPATPIKLLQKFVKDVREAEGKPEVKTGLVDQVLLGESEMKMLAELPSAEIVKAMFLGLLNAPAQKFVSLMNAGPAQFARLLEAYRKKLEEEGTSAEA